MRLPRGVVKKRRSYFARIQTKGGEESFPLGRDPDVATTKVNAIKAALDAGRTPEEIRAHLRDGTHPLAPKVAPETKPAIGPTVSEVADRWLRERVDVELEPRNAGIIRSRVEGYVVPFLGPKPIRSVSRADCHAFKGHMRTTRPDLMPSTLRHYLRTLRELLSWARRSR